MADNWRHPGTTGKVVYAVGAALIGTMLAIVSRLQIAGVRARTAVVEQLPEGAIIVAANHTSYADGPLLAVVCRRMGRSLRLLATAGVFRIPVVGWMARRVGFIPVQRGTERAADSLSAAIEALRAGEAVGIFPEGRVSRDPDHRPERGKTGAIRLALATGAPIIPVAMVGAHRVVGRDHLARQLVKSIVLRPKVYTAVGAPIDAAAWVTDPTDEAQVRDATDLLMDQLTALVASLPTAEGVTAASEIAAD